MAVVGLFGAILILGSVSSSHFNTQAQIALVVGCVCLALSILEYALRQHSLTKAVAAHRRADTATAGLLASDDPRETRATGYFGHTED